MVSDRREFIRLDVGYFDNPKIADALDESPLAVVLHVASMAHARQHRTDGVVSRKQLLRKVGAAESDAKILLDLGLWHDLGAGKIEVHDYAKHQETREEIEARSESARKAIKKRWDRARDTERTTSGNTERIADGTSVRNTEERRGEKRRATAAEPLAEVPDRPDMNPDAILQSHGIPEADRRAFKAWIIETRNVRSLAPWLTKVQAGGEVPELILAWRAATKPKKAHPSRDPGSPHYGQEWMFRQ
jgi:hypothetical protein